MNISDNENGPKRTKSKSTNFHDSSSISFHQEYNDKSNDAFRLSICKDNVIEPLQCKISKNQTKKLTSKSSLEKIQLDPLETQFDIFDYCTKNP